MDTDDLNDTSEVEEKLYNPLSQLALSSDQPDAAATSGNDDVVGHTPDAAFVKVRIPERGPPGDGGDALKSVDAGELVPTRRTENPGGDSDEMGNGWTHTLGENLKAA